MSFSDSFDTNNSARFFDELSTTDGSPMSTHYDLEQVLYSPAKGLEINSKLVCEPEGSASALSFTFGDEGQNVTQFAFQFYLRPTEQPNNVDKYLVSPTSVSDTAGDVNPSTLTFVADLDEVTLSTETVAIITCCNPALIMPPPSMPTTPFHTSEISEDSTYPTLIEQAPVLEPSPAPAPIPSEPLKRSWDIVELQEDETTTFVTFETAASGKRVKKTETPHYRSYYTTSARENSKLIDKLNYACKRCLFKNTHLGTMKRHVASKHQKPRFHCKSLGCRCEGDGLNSARKFAIIRHLKNEMEKVEQDLKARAQGKENSRRSDAVGKPRGSGKKKTLESINL